MKQSSPDPWILSLPKLDLHCHLEGAVRPETVWELSREQNIVLPFKAAADVASLVSADGVCRNLVDYLQLFSPIMRCIQTASALRRIAREAVEDAFACGVIYLEVRFAPQQLLEKGLTLDSAVKAVIDGLAEGTLKTGTIAKLIVICMRHHSPALNDAVLECASRYFGNGVCAIDFAGDEVSHPPLAQACLFEKASLLGIPFTIHAGESAGVESMKEALILGAKRIGHGVRLCEDPNLLNYFVRHEIGMELCPTSNIDTHAVEGWESYPIRDYLISGLKITVNTDNPTISNTNMNLEYKVLHERFGFGEKEFKTLALNAIGISFASHEEKEQLKNRIEHGYSRSLKTS